MMFAYDAGSYVLFDSYAKWLLFFMLMLLDLTHNPNRIKLRHNFTCKFLRDSEFIISFEQRYADFDGILFYDGGLVSSTAEFSACKWLSFTGSQLVVIDMMFNMIMCLKRFFSLLAWHRVILRFWYSAEFMKWLNTADFMFQTSSQCLAEAKIFEWIEFCFPGNMRY